MLSVVPVPESTVEMRRRAMWRKILKNTSRVKMSRAGRPRLRRTFPRSGR